MVTTRCRLEYAQFCSCMEHEIQVELDKLRRDTRRHTEWWWLNLYDESGEIGDQREWEPEQALHRMWFKNILYNFIFKPSGKQSEETLRSLEIKQGPDLDFVKQ